MLFLDNLRGFVVVLVIVLHGYKGTAESMEQYSTFSSVADRGGFLGAYPQAAGAAAQSDSSRVAGRRGRCITRWCARPPRWC